MVRSVSGALLALCFASLLQVPSVHAEPEVKVSLSREDPNVQVGDIEGEGPYEFFLFVDNYAVRGGEIGLSIDGGELAAYIIDTDLAWIVLPMPNPYPGTIAQATTNCADYPVYFGRLLVTPDEPGGRVEVDVIPSLRAAEATLLRCDFEPHNGFNAFPATVNGGDDVLAPHQVIGSRGEPGSVAPEKAGPVNESDS